MALLIAAPALAGALLLAVAGAQKLIDPTMTVGALRALGVAATPLLVRAGAAAELVLGAGALVSGGEIVWGLVALSYVAFALFVVQALKSATPLGTCGCFGRADTPPHPAHILVNLVFVGVAVSAGRLSCAPADEIAERGVAGALTLLAALAVAGAAYAVFTRRGPVGRSKWWSSNLRG